MGGTTTNAGSSGSSTKLTTMHFQGMEVEVPSTVSFIEEEDGSIILSFEKYTGTITMRHYGQQQQKAGSMLTTTPAAAAVVVSSAEKKKKKKEKEKNQDDYDEELALLLGQPDDKENEMDATPITAGVGKNKKAAAATTTGGKRALGEKKNTKKEQRKSDQAEEEDDDRSTTHTRNYNSTYTLGPASTLIKNESSTATSTSSSSSSRKKAKREVVLEAPTAPQLAPRPFGAPPQGRWGHTATMVSPNRMVIYGGEGDDLTGKSCTFGDLFVYELGPDGKGVWEKPINCDSIPRAWHSSTFLADKNLMVAFGGERVGESGIAEVLDDIMVLDTELFLWYPPAISGKAPSARSGHSASLVGKDLIVFGGSRGRGWQNNVCVLDVDRWHWRAPSIVGNPPPGRSYHSAVVVPLATKGEEGEEKKGGQQQHDAMIVFWGGNDGDTCFDQVHVLKVGSSTAAGDDDAVLSPSGGGGGGGGGPFARSPSAWEWFHPHVVGKVRPEKRTGHAACLLEDGKTILIQGGWDPHDNTKDEITVYGNAFLLDTETWEWSMVEEGKEGVSLLKDKLIYPTPGVMVGHTAMLVQQGGGGVSEEGEGEGGGKGEVRVCMFGGQDYQEVRREDLFVVKT